MAEATVCDRFKRSIPGKTGANHQYDARTELVQLAAKIDWQWLDGEIVPIYCDGVAGGPHQAAIKAYQCDAARDDFG